MHVVLHGVEPEKVPNHDQHGEFTDQVEYILVLDDFQVRDEDHAQVEDFTTEPEVESRAIRHCGHLLGDIANHQEHKGLEGSLEEPLPKDEVAEQQMLQTHDEVPWVCQEL